MDSHKDMISKLKFISKVQEGEKINVRGLFIQQDGITTRLSRTFYNLDNRGNTLNFVENTVKRCFEIISLYKRSENESERQICLSILDDLTKSKIGIINLMKTYEHDIMFISRMETLLDEIDTQIKVLHGDSEKYTNAPGVSPSLSGKSGDDSPKKFTL
jgi:hypothetical protein